MTAMRRSKRAAAAAILVAGGVGVGAASWTGGQHGWAIASIVVYVVLAVVTYMWAGSAVISPRCCAAAGTSGSGPSIAMQPRSPLGRCHC